MEDGSELVSPNVIQMGTPKPLHDYVDSLPTPEELRTRLAQNPKERALIKRLMRLAEQRDKLRTPPARGESEVTSHAD